MPYVSIRVTNEGLTETKKSELIAGVTDLLRTVLNKNPETTVVIIDEVPMDSWGIGGQSVAVRRSREASAT
ncbi:MAG TPA: 4-oxalocrotonate tautomerase family protein [Gammaproteobacteria bacterium]|nr:4-oxalocrotonate tautomerase family protein [Gammaproteobacteria bacterium]